MTIRNGFSFATMMIAAQRRHAVRLAEREAARVEPARQDTAPARIAARSSKNMQPRFATTAMA